jgi:hypothetical protein
MFLDPINAITSIEFYKKVAKQSLGRTAAYIALLSLLFTLALTVALKVKVGPAIDDTFVWLEKTMPRLTFANGKLSADPEAAVTLRHPKIEEVALIIDTARTEAVSAADLEKAKVSAYITGTAMYVAPGPGEVRVHEFGSAPNTPGQQPVVIDSKFYKELARITRLVLYPSLMIVVFLFFISWTLMSTAFYSLVGVGANTVANGGLEYKSLFNIALYAQTLITALQAIFLFMPVGLPLAPLVSLILTTTYIWLAVKANSQSPVVVSE